MERIYEYQVFDHGRWLTMQAFQDEHTAIDTAQAAIRDIRHDKVRVLSVMPAGETVAINRVIFHKEIEVAVKDVKLGELFERPAICHEAQDLYTANARLTLNRLLAEYCQHNNTTVTEILHSRFYFRQLRRNEELLNHALEHVARLQWTEQEPVATRMLSLETLLDQVEKRLESLHSQSQSAQAMEHLRALALKTVHDNPDDLFRLGGVWADLMGSRSTPLSKLALALEIVGMFDPHRPPAIQALLDLQLADLLYNPDLQEQLFGPLGSRGELIYMLLALAEGIIGQEGLKPRPIGSDVALMLERLKDKFSHNRLSCSRDHLINLATLHLNNPDPLDLRDNNSNNALFRMIVELIGRCPELMDNQRLVLAMTRRVSRHANVHSGNLLVEARHLGVLMKNPAMAILYWTRMHENSRNHDLKRGLAQRIYETLEHHNTLEELIPGRLSIQQRMRQITMCYTALANTSIDPKILAPVLGRLDIMLIDYTRKTKMLEKINDPSLTLRDRAFRLVRFCSSGMLPEGPVLLQIRQTVIDMLRRPRFHDEMVADIDDPHEVTHVQRQFYEALHHAGFAV